MSVTIDAEAIWANTGVHLTAGATYRFSARGRWKDASIDTDAAGYPSSNVFQRMTERLRRVPDAPWFALVGAVDRRPDTQFVIGTGCVHRPMADGELTCFANDLRGFYFNNHGFVMLTVEEGTGDRTEP